MRQALKTGRMHATYRFKRLPSVIRRAPSLSCNTKNPLLLNPALLKKYLPTSGSSSVANPLVTTESCPPGLWKSQQEIAANVAPPAPLVPASATPELIPALTQAEHAQLHVRVIALENLVIALLASATDHQLECAREMAAYISPRAGATAHPLTTHAAAEMVSIVERAIHFRGTPPR